MVIGASAGGVDALTRLCAGLTADFPAAILVVQHLSPNGQSLLPKLLSRAGPLPAVAAQDGAKVEPGQIFVAPPDHHLLLRPGQMLLRRGPLENRTRPAIDPLFRSAAIAYGPRVIGVVLTGLLDDGTEGLVAIKLAGGVSIVQDPDDAQWPSMPREALSRDHVDYKSPLGELPALLRRLSGEAAGAGRTLPPEIIAEDQIAGRDMPELGVEDSVPGRPSRISCPQCGGVLNQIDGDEGPRFRCQVGHAFTALGLQAAQASELERALGVAVRTHRDRLAMFLQMEERARAHNQPHAAERWHAAAGEARRLATLLEKASGHVSRATGQELA